MRPNFIKFVCCIAVFAGSISASAQNTQSNQSSQSAQSPYHYRDKGFKWSVGVVDEALMAAGAEISLGYMFGDHIYLGAGGRGSYHFALTGLESAVGFIDFKGYICDKEKHNSTPFLGAKAGYGLFLGDQAILAEPDMGWSWGFRDKTGNTLGLTLELGCPLYFGVYDEGIAARPQPTPKVTVAFEF